MSFEETQKDKCKIVLDFIRNNLDKDIINEFEKVVMLINGEEKWNIQNYLNFGIYVKKDNQRQNHKLKYV